MAPGARGPRSRRQERPARRALGLPAARSPPAARSRRLLSAMGTRTRHSAGRPPLSSLRSGTPGRRHARGAALPAEAAAGIPPAAGAVRRVRRAPAPGEGRLCATRVSQNRAQNTAPTQGDHVLTFPHGKRALGNAGLQTLGRLFLERM